MNKFYLGAAALTVIAVGGIAIAQANKADVTARAQARFAALDTDKNGQLSPAEFAAAREGRKARRGGRGSGGMLERLDTDGNGLISRAEMTAHAEARFDRIDANKDGSIDAAERAAMRDQMKERRAARMGE